MDTFCSRIFPPWKGWGKKPKEDKAHDHKGAKENHGYFLKEKK
jgi:hypothetical protein